MSVPSTFMNFKTYTLLSLAGTFGIIAHAFQKQEGSFFNTVVYLSSQKLNLLVFFNFFIVTLINLTNILIWVFFDSIRSIEYKYLMDKSQKKIFHFLLLALILRSTFDLYKFLSLAVLFGQWIIHWLVYKRSDYLVSRGSRGIKDHARLLILYVILIFADFIIAYAFYERFQTGGEKMNEIYVIIGFEFMRLLLKAIQDNFKYTISLFELYHREQWTEKGFVFNIISFVFDFIVLLLNIKLFMYIISRQQFPLYLLSEIIDTFVRLGKSIQLFIQSRQLISKLKKLPDVNAPADLPAGVDNTCIICLEEITQAKKLKCGHIFHLNCLRRWLEQNVQCPTCRDKIELDYTSPNPAINRENQRMRERDAIAARRRAARMARRIELINVENQQFQPQVEEEKKEEVTAPAPSSIDKVQIEPPLTPQVQTEEINEIDALAKLREQRLSRFRSTGSKQTQHQHLSTQDLKEVDRLLDEITNDFFNTPVAAAPSNPPTFKMEEELKEDFKDIFKVTQDELLDLIDRNNQQYTHNNNLNFMDELLSQGSDQHNVPNNAELLNMSDEEMVSSKSSEERKEVDGQEEYVFEKKVQKEEKHLPIQPQIINFGSVPYGLPCIAMTRRTIDLTLRNKQIEMINDKICKVMRQPAHYVKVQQ